MKTFDLDNSLIDFSGNEKNSWTIRQAVEGVQIWGGIGSGKTTGSGRVLALKYLSNGFGGLVLTAKIDEKELWQEYCRLTNRTNDLIIVEPGGEHFFNFLEYESSFKGAGKSITENIVQVLKTVIESSEEKSGGKTDDPFWSNALDMLLFNTIDLCNLAYGKVSVQGMYNIVLTAPKKGEPAKEEFKSGSFGHAFTNAQKNVNKQIDAYIETLSIEQKKLFKDADAMEDLIIKAIPDAAILRSIDQFFIEHYRSLSEKTRSIIDFSFSGFLFRLLKEPVHSLLCNTPSTFTPEDCLKGKIILLNLPVKLYHKVGRDCQVMFKYIWQRAMEKRNIKQNEQPVFLWADEAQNFLHAYDAEYQATARSSRIATVYISQNLPNYHANMGGFKSEYRVKSFLGTLATQIFHANTDIETNKYASELIGEGYTVDTTNSATVAGNFSSSRTQSLKLEKMVRPEEFVKLKSGGKLNNLLIEGYMYVQGKPFSGGLNFKKISFKQN